jgi:hypothetical protein
MKQNLLLQSGFFLSLPTVVNGSPTLSLSLSLSLSLPLSPNNINEIEVKNDGGSDEDRVRAADARHCGNDYWYAINSFLNYKFVSNLISLLKPISNFSFLFFIAASTLLLDFSDFPYGCRLFLGKKRKSFIGFVRKQVVIRFLILLPFYQKSGSRLLKRSRFFFFFFFFGFKN